MKDGSTANARTLRNLVVDVDRREVARLLGYPPGPLPGRVLDMIVDTEKRASGLVQPLGVYRLLDRASYPQSDYLGGVERAALGLVSIGDALEGEVERYRTQGSLGPALILDAYGSAAAEAAAAAAEMAIRAAVENETTRCSRRFSPGYGGWDLQEQRWIIDALGGHDIGVTLTEGCMMKPRKSVTFAMSVGEDPVELRDDDICESCGEIDCPWKDTPQRCAGRRNP